MGKGAEHRGCGGLEEKSGRRKWKENGSEVIYDAIIIQINPFLLNINEYFPIVQYNSPYNVSIQPFLRMKFLKCKRNCISILEKIKRENINSDFFFKRCANTAQTHKMNKHNYSLRASFYQSISSEVTETISLFPNINFYT